MSSDLERRLRDGRSALPDPETEVTSRARARALAALARRRFRSPLAVGVAVVVAVALGVGIGASIAPSGTAAEGPVGFGFLPVNGWYVMQNGAEGTPERPAIAIASNVPIDPEDGGSIVPYSTLIGLPPEGAVVVANFTGPVSYPSDVLFPSHEPPLQVADAVRGIQFGAQVRPREPLGQYQLRRTVNGQPVDLHFYFGTPEPAPELVAETQRQLDRLVVAPERRGADPRSATKVQGAQQAASRLVDRTFLCTPSYGRAKIVASPQGTLEVVGSRFVSSGYTRLTTGPDGDPLNDLAVVARPGFRNGGTRYPAAVYASVRRCAASRATVPLTRAGLPGPAVAFRTDADCMLRRVLVRVRALLRTPATWRRLGGSIGSAYVGVGGRVVEAELAVRDPATGKPLAYVTLGHTGKTKLWTRC